MKELREIISANKVKKKVCLFFVCTFIIGIMFYNFLLNRCEIVESEILSPYVDNCNFTNELIDGMIIEQSFTTSLDAIEGIYLETGTYARQNTSHISVSILNDNNVELYNESFSLQDAIDNQFSYFKFSETLNVDNYDKLILRLESEGNKGGNGISLVYSTSDSYIDGEFIINDEKQIGDCFFGISGYNYNNNEINILYIIGAGILLLYVVTMIVLLISKKNKEGEVLISNTDLTFTNVFKSLIIFFVVIFIGKTDYYVINNIMERTENSYMIHIGNPEEMRIDEIGVSLTFLNRANNIISNNIMLKRNSERLGTVQYSVSDMNGNLIDKQIKPLSSVIRPYSDEWDELLIDCTELELIQGDSYNVTLNFNQTKPIYIISNEKGQIQQRQVMSFAYKYVFFVAVFLVSLIILIAIGYALIQEFSDKVFLIIAIALGVLACFIETPCAADDEYRHFLRAYDLADSSVYIEHTDNYLDAKGNVIIEDDGKADLINVPSQINGLRLIDKTANYDNISYDAEMNYSGCIDEVYRLFFSDEGNSQYVSIAATSEMPIIVYLPQIIFIFVGKLLGITGIGLFYFGRIGNMIIATLATYVAVNMAPRYKNLFYVLHFAPNAFWIRSSCNRDAFVTAVAMLLVAYILRMKEKKLKLLEFKRITMLSVLVVILTILKLPYVLIVGFIMVLDKENTANIKTWRCFGIKVGIVFFLGFVGIMGYKIAYYTPSTYDNLTEEVIFNVEDNDTKEVSHLSYAIEHPKVVISAILRRFMSLTEDIYRAIEGYRFQYTYKYLFMTLVIIIMSKGYLNIIDKLWVALVYLAVWISIIVAGYTMAAPDIGYIWGVNPRYMIPVLPLLGVIFTSGNEKTDRISKLIMPPWVLTITAMDMVSLIPVYW